MEMNQIRSIARRLYDRHGLKAEAEAARKLQDAESAGNKEDMATWRRVRSVVHDMRGAHQG